MQRLELKRECYKDYVSWKTHYNAIGMNIRLKGRLNKRIAITSVKKNEGKTTVTMHLALSLIEAGCKVLLLDMDVRQKGLIDQFKADNNFNNLSQFLLGKVGLTDVVIPTNIPNLSVAFLGEVAGNPIHLIQSENLSLMFEELEEEYDYILIDTPAMELYSDVVSIVKQANAFVLVVEARKAKIVDIKKSVLQLEHSGAQFFGVVLNKGD